MPFSGDVVVAAKLSCGGLAVGNIEYLCFVLCLFQLSKLDHARSFKCANLMRCDRDEILEIAAMSGRSKVCSLAASAAISAQQIAVVCYALDLHQGLLEQDVQ